jgi:prepilin-type N-terminal cleavage/methylation domain-containing protein
MLTRIRRRLSADDGVSLVEMMVAMIILGITLFGLASSLVSSLTGSRAAHNEFDASQRSQVVVEDLLRRPIGTASDWANPAWWVPPALGVVRSPTYPDEVRGSAVYRYATQVEWVDDPCNGSDPGSPGVPDARLDYLRITVTTTWTAPDQTDRTHTVVVYRFPPHSSKTPARHPAC